MHIADQDTGVRQLLAGEIVCHFGQRHNVQSIGMWMP
jgi:hypothetical protein